MASEKHVLGLQWRSLNRNDYLRDYLDFLIDGESLYEALRVRDRVGILGGSFPNALMEAIYLKGLLLEHPSYLETGRYEFFVCPLCGDVGCGSITAEIEGIDDRVVWRDFAVEVNYWFDDPSEIYQQRWELEPFEFDRAQYREALLAWPIGRPNPMPPKLQGVL